jgi:hypothetical protein
MHFFRKLIHDLLGCNILCIESLVEVDRLEVKVEGRSDRLGRVKMIDNKSKRSADKRSCGYHLKSEWRLIGHPTVSQL